MDAENFKSTSHKISPTTPITITSNQVSQHAI
jgi:hypothetical protein